MVDLFVGLLIDLLIFYILSLGLGDSGRFKDKTDFPTLTRFSYCQCRMRKVFGSIFRQFDWTAITVVMDRDDEHALIVGETLDVGLQKGGFLPNIIKYYGQSKPNMSAILQDASKVSRGKQKGGLLIFKQKADVLNVLYGAISIWFYKCYICCDIFSCVALTFRDLILNVQ